MVTHVDNLKSTSPRNYSTCIATALENIIEQHIKLTELMKKVKYSKCTLIECTIAFVCF